MAFSWSLAAVVGRRVPVGQKPLAVAGRVLDEALTVGRDASTFPAADEDYFRDMDGGVPLTPEEIKGRNSWIVWTAGNDRFWDGIGVTAYGALDFLKTLSSHPQPEGQPRSAAGQYLGLVNEPCFVKPTGPDPKRHGLWLDQRSPDCPPDPFENEQKYPGVADRRARQDDRDAAPTTAYATGIVGLRLFPNPDFDEQAAKAWDANRYLHGSRATTTRTRWSGRTAWACRAASATSVRTRRSRPRIPRTRSGRTSAPTSGRSTSGSTGSSTGTRTRRRSSSSCFTPPAPGSLDTSLISTDNINNPRTMNAVYLLLPRLLQAKRWGKETLAGGGSDNRQFNDYVKEGPLTQFFEAPATVWTPRVLKDGADSVGALGALNRVYHQHRDVQRRVAAALQRAGRRQARIADPDRRRAEEFGLLPGDRSANAGHRPFLSEDHRRALI